ncbi:MAG TPA: CoA ligase, partial [Flavobacteriaceae bacterium]|nr:CoA ligase [Flavobacteriaceae bacterium]
MINTQLLNPSSIAVIGASNDYKKPGGHLLKNLLSGSCNGTLSVVNPKEEKVQGISSFKMVQGLPETDLAILAIPAKYYLEAVTILAEEKNTKAFIII